MDATAQTLSPLPSRRAHGAIGEPVAGPEQDGAGDEPPTWLTATIRPAGVFGRSDVGRLRGLLDALTACASIVVLDLQAAQLRSPRAAAVIDEAARRLEVHGGCLLCVNVDDSSRAALAGAGPHAVLLGEDCTRRPPSPTVER